MLAYRQDGEKGDNDGRDWKIKMKKQMKFTFKTIKPTGRYRSFEANNHHIKLKRKQLGSIDDKFPHSIRLMVVKKDILEDGNPNCNWKWITLSKKSDSIKEAKEFLNNNIEGIMNKYTLHQHDSI